MTVDLYNIEAKNIDKIDLPDRVWSAPWNPDLVKAALDAQVASARQNLAHAKGRGEVSGGGKKPWRQKGTGRARHGSIRSPIWKGGGVAHGPTKDKVYGKKVNQKVRQAAIFSVLSKKLEEGEIKFIDAINVPESKTKHVAKIVSVFSEKKNALIIPGVSNKNIYRASANIEKVKSLDPRSLNVYDLLKYKNILVEKDAVAAIDSHYHAV